jgi:CBS domain containing-hemolysin-like protein
MKLFSWSEDTRSNDASTNSHKSDSPTEDDLSLSLASTTSNRLDELSEFMAEHTMIPRSVLHALDADLEIRHLSLGRPKALESEYLVVYRGDLDRILGWIERDDVLRLMESEGEADQGALLRCVHPMPEIEAKAPLAKVMETFRRTGTPMIRVVDGQGLTAGVIEIHTWTKFLFRGGPDRSGGFEAEISS